MFEENRRSLFTRHKKESDSLSKQCPSVGISQTSVSLHTHKECHPR